MALFSMLNKFSFVVAPIFYKLVFLSLTATCIGLLILLIRRLADQQISPFWKYALWFLVLIALKQPIPDTPHRAGANHFFSGSL